MDEFWNKAMDEEMDQIEKNDTWELVPRPKNKNVIGGEIMKVGYTFACFMTKKIVFSQVIQLPTYKSIFFISNFTLQ
jgi:hypothetical protein